MPTSEYLDIFRQNGLLIGQIRDRAAQYAQTHHRMETVEAYTTHLIHEAGGEPAFKRVPGYHWSTCISVNDSIVHGIPKGNFKPGDLVTIDTGMYLKGTTTDTATSFVIGPATPNQTRFLKTGRKALKKAIDQVQIGHQVKDISKTIQHVIEKAGYNVVRTLTGHGIGTTMHEAPSIPCFVSSDPALRTRLQAGMVIAVEVMYMEGRWPLKLSADGWTMSTQDGSLSAVFEEDIIITHDGPEVITQTSLLEP